MMSLRKACISGLFSLLLVTHQASAQSIYVDDVTTSDPSGSISGAFMPLPFAGPFAGGYFWARGDFGDRPGADGNYFSTGAFAPIQIWGPEDMFFVDGQLWLNEHSEIGGDIGIGYRRMFHDYSHALGVNSFITGDKSLAGNRFRRFSFGGEWLTDYLGVTAQGYIPWTDDTQDFGEPVRSDEAFFTGRNLAFLMFQAAEQQMIGWDIEAGSAVPRFEWLSLYAGAYHFQGSQVNSLTGFSTRAMVDLTSAIFDLTVQNDRQFGTSVSFGGELRVGNGPLAFVPRYRNLTTQVLERVRKRHRISTQRFFRDEEELAISPRTGEPFTFVHIINTAAPGGDGSIESPFDNLELGSGTGADFKLVWRGTTSRNNLLPGGSGLVLSDFQIVLGEGSDFLLQTANREQPIRLPGFDTPGPGPFVTANPGADIITLANNNLVQGLNMIAPAGGNMFGGSGISNFTIRDINRDITPAQDTGPGGGIVLTNARGTGIISGFGMRSTNVTAAEGGIVIRNSQTPPLNLLVSDVDFLSGGRFGVDLVANNSTIQATLSDVLASQNGVGMRLQASNNAQILAGVSNSTFDDALTGDGIRLVGTTGATLGLSATNTTASGAAQDGLHINLNNATAAVNLTNGSLIDAGDDAVHAILNNGANLALGLQNTPGSNAAGRGLNLQLDNNSRLTGTLTASDFIGVGGDAIGARLDNGSSAALTITNSSYANAGGDGINALITNGASLAINATNTTFANAAGDGLSVTAINSFSLDPGALAFMGQFTSGSFGAAGGDGISVSLDRATANLILQGTSAANVGGHGFSFLAENGSTFGAQLQNGVSFSNAGGSAIHGRVLNFSSATINGIGVSGANAGENAIDLVVNRSTLEMTMNSPGSFANAGGDALNLLNVNDGTADILFGQGGPVDFSGAAGNGLFARTGANSTTTLIFQNGADFSNAAGGDAIHLLALSNADVRLGGTNVSGANAAGRGIFLDARDGSAITVGLDSAGSFANAGSNAIQYRATGGSEINIGIAGGDFSNAGGRGMTGSLTDSFATIVLDGGNFDNAAQDGFVLNATNSTATGGLFDTVFTNAGGTGLAFTLQTTSVVDFDLDNVDARNAAGHGFLSSTQTGSSATFRVQNGLQLDNAGLDALRLTAIGGSSNTLSGSGLSGADAGGNGIFLDALNADIALSLTNSGPFTGAGESGLRGVARNGATIGIQIPDGIAFDNAGASALDLTATTGANLALTGSGLSGANAGGHGIFLDANGGDVALLLTNSGPFTGAAQSGLRAIADNGGNVAIQLPDGIAFDNAGASAVDLEATNSTLTLAGSGLSGANAGGDGIRAVSTESIMHLNMTNVGSFANATGDGVNVTVNGGSFPDFRFNLSGLAGAPADFSGAGGHGLNLVFNNHVGFDPNQPTFTVDRANFNNATRNGFNLESHGNFPGSESTFNGLVTNSSFDNAGENAWQAFLTGNNPESRMRIQNSFLRNATEDAVNITALDNTNFNVFIQNSDLSGAGGDTFDITQDGSSTVNLFVNPSQVDRGFRFSANGNSVLNANILSTPLSTADERAIYGVFGTLTNGATMNLRVEDSGISETIQDGLNVTASGGSAFNATFINSSISDSGLRGFVLDLDNSNANLNFTAGSTITGSGASNLVLSARNGSSAQFNFDFSSGDLSNAATDALFVHAQSGAQGDSTVRFDFAGAANLDNAGRDGLSLNADGSRINVNAHNGLSIDNAGNRAISVFGTDALVGIVADDVSLANAGGHAFQTILAANSTVNAQFTNVSSLSGSGGDAVNFSASNSFLAIGISGNDVLNPVRIDNAGGHGINGTATSGSTVVLDLQEFTINGAGQDGIRLNLDNSNLLTSRLVNGVISNNGQSGADSGGLVINANNNSSVGVRSIGQFGLDMNNVSIENSTGLPRSQDNGIHVIADNNSFVNARMLNGVIRQHAGHGVLVDVNPTQTPQDGSAVNLTFGNVDILNNSGDGVNLTARYGNNTVNSTTSGIVFNFAGGNISGNGNGVLGDGLGDGIEANAIGDPNGPAGNTTIILNLLNADVSGNEELELNFNATDGGVIDQSISGGTFGGPVEIVADGATSSAFLSLDGVRIVPATDVGGDPTAPAIVIHALNGGTATGIFSNMLSQTGTAISGHGGPALVFLAESAGTVHASFNNVDMLNNMLDPQFAVEPITGLAASAAVVGAVRDAGSQAFLDFTNVTITDNSTGAFDLDVTAAGSFEGTFRNVLQARNNAAAGTGDFNVRVDGAGSSAVLDIDDLTANGSTGHGIDLRAANDASLDVTQFNDVRANAAAGHGLNVAVDSGATLAGSLEITNGSFSNALNGNGVNIEIDSANVPVELLLSNVTANNALFDATPHGNGINIEVNTADAPVEILLNNVTANNARRQGVNIDVMGGADGGTHAIDLINVSANNAQGGRGLDLKVDRLGAGDAADVAIIGSSFNNAAASGVDLKLHGALGSVATVDIDGVEASNSGATGVNLFFGDFRGNFIGGIDVQNVFINNVNATDAATVGLSVRTQGGAARLRELDVSTGNFNRAGADGVRIGLDAQIVSANLALTNVTANNAAGEGISIDMRGVHGDSSLLLEGVLASKSNALANTGGNGLILSVTELAAADTFTAEILASSFNGAGGDGLDILLDGAAGSTATFDFGGVNALNASGNGVDVNLSNGISAAINSLDDVNASGAGGIGLNVLAAMPNVTLTRLDSTGANFSNAGGNGVNVVLNNQNDAAAISFVDLNADDAAGRGVNIQLANVRGESSVNLEGVNARNAGARGLNLDVTGQQAGDSIDVNLRTADFSSAGGSGAIVNILGEPAGGGTAALTIDGLTVNDSAADGLRLSLDNAVDATMSTFSNLSALRNRDFGAKIDVLNGSSLDVVEADGLNLSNNSALSVAASGLEIRVLDGSTAAFNISNLTIDNAGFANFGKGINLDVQGADSQLDFNLAGGTVTGTGREGINIAVGTVDPGAVFNGDFAGLSVTNGSTAPQVFRNGIHVHVSGDGTPAGPDNTRANFLFDDVAANGHSRGDGYHFRVDDGGKLDVTLTGGSTGSNNGGRGLFLDAFGTGTDVTLVSHSGTNGQVNSFNGNGTLPSAGNNGGHGLQIRLEQGDPDPSGAALTAQFELEASANGNAGDGIRVIANRDPDGGVDISDLGITATNVNVNNNQGNGLTVDLDNVASIRQFDLRGMSVSQNQQDQINVRFANMELETINFSDVVATGPGAAVGTGNGITLTLDNTEMDELDGLLSLDRIQSTQNGRDGLQVNLMNGAVIPVGSRIDVGTFNNNGRHGIHVRMDDAHADLNVTNSTVQFGTVASASSNAASGLHVGMLNGSALTMDVDNQVLNSNGIGMSVSTSGGSTFNADENLIVERQLNTTEPDALPSITDNVISNNSQFGFRGSFLDNTFDPASGSPRNLTFDVNIGSRTNPGTGNVFHNNGGAGINVDMVQGAQGRIAILDSQITGTNNIAADPAFNGDAIMIRMLGTGVAAPGHALLANHENAAEPGLLIQRNTIGVTGAGAQSGNAGFGLNFDVREQAVIQGVDVLDNTISFNGAGGIEFRRRDLVQVDGNGFLIDRNDIEFNNGNGIAVLGHNSGTDAMRVIIGRDDNPDPRNQGPERVNNITGWLDSLDGNRIAGNANNGIFFDVRADSQLEVDIQENLIINNQNNGILMTETALSGDTRHINGLRNPALDVLLVDSTLDPDPADFDGLRPGWHKNVIANNANRGILSNANASIAVTESIVGAVFDPFGNVMIDTASGIALDGNASTGIELNAAGNYTFGLPRVNNATALPELQTRMGVDIIRNGRLVTADPSTGHGIDIQGVAKTVTVQNSLIQRNFQDGVEVLTQPNRTINVNLIDNRINDNIGRGIDVLTRGDLATTNLLVEGTVDPRQSQGLGAFAAVSSNGEEGIYIVNTAATSETQDQFSFIGLQQDGGLTARPNTNATISGVDISFNGNDIQNFGSLRPGGSGLVVRVGTSHASLGTGNGPATSDEGGFAMDGRAGVRMEIDRNYVNGNTGDGMFFHGYRSTASSGTGTTWNEMEFNAMGYRTDPLARLDIHWGVSADANVFAGGDELNANNPLRVASPDGQAGAFYNDSDGVFKSRLNNIMAPNIAGPFTSATRRRNAQRQALRVYAEGTPQESRLNPQTGPGLDFLYPGMGQSTFRVSPSTGLYDDLVPDWHFGGLGGFNFDFNSDTMLFGTLHVQGGARGTPYTGSVFGELPFGWGIFDAN